MSALVENRYQLDMDCSRTASLRADDAAECNRMAVAQGVREESFPRYALSFNEQRRTSPAEHVGW
jgi:hypothetical protein